MKEDERTNMKKYLKTRIKYKKTSGILIGILSLLSVLLLAGTFVIPKIMAGDTVVSDLSIQGESQGKTISLTVTDNNENDTKVVLPLAEGVTYQSNTNSTIGVTEDTVNHQLVIDWIEGQAKQVTLQLEADKEGTYDFTAYTVREEQPVSSVLCSVHVQSEEAKTSTSSEEDTDLNQADIDEQPDATTPEMSSHEKLRKSPAAEADASSQVSGTWGTSAWEFDETTRALTIHEGTTGTWRDTPWVTNKLYPVKTIRFDGKVFFPADSGNLFANLTSLETFENINSVDTSRVTDMQGMFLGSKSLETLDVSNWDTSQVTDMSGMFTACKDLETLDLSNWNTSQVTNMKGMFSSCELLTKLDVSNWNTSQVTNMNNMFSNCGKLITLDVSNWNTSQVTDISYMFWGCLSLESLPVLNWDTSQVTNMSYMFYGGKVLKHLNVSNWNTSQVTDMSGMFTACKDLETLDLSNWTIDRYTYKSQMLNFMSLSRLILGEKVDLNDTYLGAPKGLYPDDELTGNWIKEYDQSQSYTPNDFMKKYGSGDLTPGTYVAEFKRELKFENVPESLNFNDAEISGRTSYSKRKDADWKITVKDTYVDRHWRVTAQLSEQFKDSSGNTLNDNILLFRKTNQPDQWITPDSEINVFEGSSLKDKRFQDISWKEDEGPLIQAAPGTVKLGEYTGVINWKLIDAPV